MLKSVIKILRLLESGGYEGYIVGGAVRDRILGVEPKDYDITTNATIEQMKNVFKGYKIVPTGEQYGTITIIVEEKGFEITTYRRDGHYSDGRRPDWVEFTNNIEDSLSRRDFTINAMAYNPLTDTIIDPFLWAPRFKKRNNKVRRKPR